MEHKTVAKARKAPARDDPVRRGSARPRSTGHPIMDLQRSIGNQAVQRLIDFPYLRAKSNVRSSRDQYPVEEETEPVAENAIGKCAACEGGRAQCPTCAEDAAAPAEDHTYTFISRGSYGQTRPGFAQPACAAGVAPGTSTMGAGSANPTITVYPTGTYRVRRDDGVVQTATCTRSAAGLAATTAHENSHAAGARAAAVAANTAAGLPQNFATPALCAAALPAVVTAWNAVVGAAWANERVHGPGTNPPTAPTFAEEHAAGLCAFA